MTSKRKQVRENAIVKREDLQAFVNEFQSESDRATAILGAALLDEKLRQLLEAFLVDDKEQVELLIDTERPLGSFGARIRVAYCLGLFDKNCFDILLIVKAIRNDFAHQLHGLSFETTTIAKECDKLRTLVPMSDYVEDSPRGIFLSSVLSTQLQLWGMTTSIEAGQRRCRIPQRKTLMEWKREEG